MRIVLQVLNWRVVDTDLAIGLCTILSKAAVVDILWKMISSAWQNYDKIKVRIKFALSARTYFLVRLIRSPIDSFDAVYFLNTHSQLHFARACCSEEKMSLIFNSKNVKTVFVHS